MKLGGEDAPVQVQEHAEKPQDQTIAAPIVDFSDELYDTYNKGTAWPKEMFYGKGSSEILQAIRLFTQKVNHARSEASEPIYNILELEQLVERQTVSLALTLQNLCRWAVLVRVGVRKMQRDLLGLVAMVPMPPKGSVKLNRPADNVGRTHYVVSHIFGDRFLCRGYAFRITDEGDWVLGGPEGNRWFKDLWLTPGLQAIDTLVENKRRKLSPRANAKLSKREQRTLDQQCEAFRTKIESSRKAAGVQSDKFGAAYGARLDLENKEIMLTALGTVRALLAQIVVYQEDGILDDIAGRCGCHKADLISNPAAAGTEEQSVRYHLERREHAYSYFRPVGSLPMPDGYMVFAEQGVPERIPAEARTEIAGISGVAVGASWLSKRSDAALLRRNPAALPEVEDLTPLIEVCGVSTLNGRTVNNMNVVDKEEGSPAEATQYMEYSLAGQSEQAEMPVADFLKKISVRFVPMVINLQRRRLNVEDLQGSVNGVSYAVSFEDVNERFRPCPKKSAPSTG